jgi:hypothetical protein
MKTLISKQPSEPSTLPPLQANVAQVLSLVLQHAPVSDLSTICSMLRVCKRWRAALQGCQPCLELMFTFLALDDLKRLAAFASWVQTQGHFVKSLQMSGLVASYNDSLVVAASTILSLAFSLTKAVRGSRSLGLQELSTDFQPQRILASLSGVPLTSLTITNPMGADIKLLLSALQPFSSLRELYLGDENGFDSTISPGSRTCLQGLSSLIKLDLHGRFPWWDLLTLPGQLRDLAVSAGRVPCLLNISHLTCLTRLEARLSQGFGQGSQLPGQLKELQLTGTLLPADIHIFNGVQALALTPAVDQGSRLLAQLAGLRGLQSLTLQYSDVACAAKHACAWKQLPQLRMLLLKFEDVSEGEDMETVLGGLGQAVSLTGLELSVYAEDEMPGCFVHLVGLTQLQSLEVEGSHTDRDGMLHLQTLSQLTALTLRYCSFDDGTAAVALGSLKQLHTLDLAECDELTDAVLPLVAQQLSNLRDLSLLLPNAITGDSMPLLTRLTQLTKLLLPRQCGLDTKKLGQVLRCNVVC